MVGPTALELRAHPGLEAGQVQDYKYAEGGELDLYFQDNELAVDLREKMNRLKSQNEVESPVSVDRESAPGRIAANATELNKLKKEELVTELSTQILRRKAYEQQVDRLWKLVNQLEINVGDSRDFLLLSVVPMEPIGVLLQLIPHVAAPRVERWFCTII